MEEKKKHFTEKFCSAPKRRRPTKLNMDLLEAKAAQIKLFLKLSIATMDMDLRDGDG